MNVARSVSVVIPVYNSAPTLSVLVERVTAVLDSMDFATEVILVNDGSHDASWDQIVALSQEYSSLRGINLMRNYGQENAILAGIRAARGEYIVTMDDDLQHPPEEIPRLIEKLGEGYDVVYGVPFTGQHGPVRNFASRFSKSVVRVASGVDPARQASAFRAFRARLRDTFGACNGPLVMIDVYLTWGTTRFAAIPTHHEPRRVGKSNYNFWTLSVVGVNMLIGYSTWPLRFASLVGFVFTLFGIGALAYVLAVDFIEGGVVPGFPFLASMIAIFAGAQLFALGIFGEYLARMYSRLMDRPAYTVRDGTDANSRQESIGRSVSTSDTQGHGVNW